MEPVITESATGDHYVIADFIALSKKGQKSEKGNMVYRGGKYITQPIGGSSKPHLIKVNVMMIDCGVVKNKK